MRERAITLTRIIHLKRFQYVNNKWIKSQKVVNFPFEDFDPTEFLAAVPQETILRHHELMKASAPAPSLQDQLEEEDAISETDTEDEEHSAPTTQQQPTKQTSKGVNRRRPSLAARRQRLESASLTATPVSDDNLVDFHQHRLLPDEDPFDLKYNLYAVVHPFTSMTHEPSIASLNHFLGNATTRLTRYHRRDF
ncbi:hypothetical protein evm_015456 [Chilo suppressalis]|nr:hypothetical protein evm_015456 [Chilo suppressalis]